MLEKKKTEITKNTINKESKEYKLEDSFSATFITIAMLQGLKIKIEHVAKSGYLENELDR